MKLSIVTPVLNRRAMIGEALASLRAQGIADVEHLVVDGGSEDGTQDVVAAEPGSRLIEAPGSSIYEAINLGVETASGDIVGLLNSDDRLAEGALAAVAAAFAAEPGIDIVHGRADTILADGRPSGDDSAALTAGPLDLRRVLLGVPAINAGFYARDLFGRVGTFDPALPVSADREWLARAVLAGAACRRLDRVLYVYRLHPGSLTIGGNKTAERDWVREHLTIARRHLSDRSLDTQARKTFAAFHAKGVANQALLALRAGEARASIGAVVAGFRARPAWPLEALAPLWRILTHRVRRAPRTQTRCRS